MPAAMVMVAPISAAVGSNVVKIVSTSQNAVTQADAIVAALIVDDGAFMSFSLTTNSRILSLVLVLVASVSGYQ